MRTAVMTGRRETLRSIGCRACFQEISTVEHHARRPAPSRKWPTDRAVGGRMPPRQRASGRMHYFGSLPSPKLGASLLYVGHWSDGRHRGYLYAPGPRIGSRDRLDVLTDDVRSTSSDPLRARRSDQYSLLASAAATRASLDAPMLENCHHRRFVDSAVWRIPYSSPLVLLPH